VHVALTVICQKKALIPQDEFRHEWQ
jgi:hypothetical protein